MRNKEKNKEDGQPPMQFARVYRSAFKEGEWGRLLRRATDGTVIPAGAVS